MKINIAQKISLLSICIILILGMFLGYYFVQQQTKILHSEMSERVNLLLTNLSVNLEYPILIQDYDGISRLVKAIVAQPDIISCKITDKDNILIYQKESEKEGPTASYTFPVVTKRIPKGTGEELMLDFHDEKVEEVIGTLHLTLSLLELNKKTNRMKTTVTIIVLTIIILASVAYQFLARFILGKPISRLAHATERIAGGEFDYRVSIKSNDEIGLLATYFNKMTSNLQKTMVSKSYVDKIIDSMIDALLVIDANGKISRVNKATEELLGYRADELIEQRLEMFIPDIATLQKGSKPDDSMKQDYGQNIEKTLVSKHGRKIPVLFSMANILDTDGEIQGAVCVALDITERKKAEAQIKASLKEKEVLLKEIHHRVKNNLQVISSLLNLQSNNLKDKLTKDIFLETKNRVRTMALVHEKLYKSKDLASIDIGEYITTLIHELFRSYKAKSKAIALDVSVDNISIDIDTAIPCGLIINELVSNSLKHAFHNNKQGEIHIGFHSKDTEYTLSVGDNGIGIPQNIDFHNTESLGLQLVCALTHQLNGSIELNRTNGTIFKVVFKH